MERISLILDATHPADKSFWEALGSSEVRFWRATTTAERCPGDRQLTDEQIKALVRAARSLAPRSITG